MSLYVDTCNGQLATRRHDLARGVIEEMDNKPFKMPPAFVTTGHNETLKIERLDDGRKRVTVYKCGKEVRSYIENPCGDVPWWKFWHRDPRRVEKL